PPPSPPLLPYTTLFRSNLPVAAAPLPAETINAVGQHLDVTGAGTGNGNDGDGDGDVPAWSAPLLVVTSPDVIANLTPADQVWVRSEEHTSELQSRENLV